MKTIASLTLVLLTFLTAASLQAQMRTVHAEWTYQDVDNLRGYRLYLEGLQVCQIEDPTATSADCQVDVSDGETSFTLTAYYQDGTESDHSAPFTYTFSSTLLAVLSASPLQGNAPLNVAFDASNSTGDGLFYEWSFGDGEVATGSSVSHVYTDVGSYTATLKTTDGSGAFDIETVTITVNPSSGANSPPNASIHSSTAAGTAPLSVTFDGSGSTDSDGSIVSYAWDLGDGSRSTGKSITHTYTVAGSYNPTLTVTDNDGATDSISTPVIVETGASINTIPVASISASANRGKIPLSITFNGNKSFDSDGSIVSYTWNFGDGTTARGKNVKHTFTVAGTYTVSLVVTDNNGGQSKPATLSIIASDKYPLDNTKVLLQPIFRLLLEEKKKPVE